MAVVVQCFHCNAVLELDDGFRGGVCRCSGCGALLQVPKGDEPSSPRRARPAAPGEKPRSGGKGGSSDSKARPARPGSKSTMPPSKGGADTGGSSSGLRRVQQTRPVAPVQKPAERGRSIRPPAMERLQRNTKLLWVALGLIAGLAVLVTALVIGMSFRGHGNAEPANTQEPAAPNRRSTGANVPAFASIPLQGSRVIISVDGASSMSEAFDYVRRGIDRTSERLAPGQRLMVVLWNGSGVTAVAPGEVTSDNAAVLRQGMESAATQGATEPLACMKATLGLARANDQVIFITAKLGLSAELAAPVLGARQNQVRIDSVKVGSQDTPSPLEEMAKATGGQYVLLSVSELDQLTR